MPPVHYLRHQHYHHIGTGKTVNKQDSRGATVFLDEKEGASAPVTLNHHFLDDSVYQLTLTQKLTWCSVFVFT